MIEVAQHHIADRERDDHQADLDGDQPVEAEIAGHNADGDGNGDRGAGKLGKGVLHETHGDQAPQAIGQCEGPSGPHRPGFPMLCATDVVICNGGAPKGAHIGVTHKTDHQKGDGDDVKRDGLVAIGGKTRGYGGSEHAAKHRHPVSIDRADNGHIVQGWHCLSG